MAKGRRLTTSRSERFFGSYSYSHSQGETVTDETELVEEDVWSVVDNNTVTDRHDQGVDNFQSVWNPRVVHESNGNGGYLGSRRIPREEKQQQQQQHVGGLSLAFEEDPSSTKPSRIVHQFRGQDCVASPRGHKMATSAPMNVPDWSKIYRVDSVESMHDDSDDGESEEMIPPHEYLARSKRTGGGASVFEGVGRTLKGRDLRRVRDAVWSQTGFDG